MNDTELDDLLARSVSPLPADLSREAVLLAEATTPARIPHRRIRDTRWFLPVLVTGSLVLTAGTGLTAMQLAHWPWVSMPIGNVRTTTPIPVDWITEDGHAESCRAWIELRNPGDGDRIALDAAIQKHDWNGFGQHLYDIGSDSDRKDAEGESRVSEGLTPALIAFTQELIPGVLAFAEPGSTVAIDAIGMSCVADGA